MKKLIKSMLFFCIIGSLSFAQSPVDKGTYKIGGELSYKSYHFDDKEDDYYRFSSTPQLYYFLLKNLSIGISTEYSYVKSAQGSKYKEFDLAPGIFYYFHYKNIYPFIFVNVGKKSIWRQSTGNFRIQPSSDRLYNIKLGFGLDFFVSENISIEPYIDYKVNDLSKTPVLKNIIGTGVRLAIFLK